jgi:hypothetical protein
MFAPSVAAHQRRELNEHSVLIIILVFITVPDALWLRSMPLGPRPQAANKSALPHHILLMTAVTHRRDRKFRPATAACLHGERAEHMPACGPSPVAVRPATGRGSDYTRICNARRPGNRRSLKFVLAEHGFDPAPREWRPLPSVGRARACIRVQAERSWSTSRRANVPR